MWNQEYSLEGRYSSPGIDVELRNYCWPADTRVEVLESAYRISLLMSARQGGVQGCLGADQQLGTVGDILFLPAAVAFQGCTGGTHRILTCAISHEMFLDLTAGQTHWNPLMLSACLDIHEPRIHQTLLRLAAEMTDPGLMSESLTEALGVSLVVDLMRYLERAQESAQSSRGGLAAWQVRRIRERVSEWREGPIPTVSDLARLVGIGPRHLMRAFRQSQGISVGDFLGSVRLARAIELLTGSELLIKQVAQKVGFLNQNNFCDYFRRATGEAPNSYRQKRRRGGCHGLAS